MVRIDVRFLSGAQSVIESSPGRYELRSLQRYIRSVQELVAKQSEKSRRGTTVGLQGKKRMHVAGKINGEICTNGQGRTAMCYTG